MWLHNQPSSLRCWGLDPLQLHWCREMRDVVLQHYPLQLLCWGMDPLQLHWPVSTFCKDENGLNRLMNCFNSLRVLDNSLQVLDAFIIL